MHEGARTGTSLLLDLAAVASIPGAYVVLRTFYVDSSDAQVASTALGGLLLVSIQWWKRQQFGEGAAVESLSHARLLVGGILPGLLQG